MPWVKFIENYEFRPTPRVILVYKASRRYLVKAACAEQAIREGKAIPDDGDRKRPQESGRVLR